MSYSIIQEGTGELLSFPDPFKEVTEDDVTVARVLEQEVLYFKGQIEKSFILMGKALIEFRDAKGYLALGFESMSLWCQSDSVDISYSQAKSLIRIVEDLLPILTEAGVQPLTSVSKMRELLPLISEGKDLAEAAEAIRDLKIIDAKEVIREIRGLAEPEEGTIFKAYVTKRVNENDVKIMCYGRERVYVMGTLRIHQNDMARWMERFGRFLEHE